MTDTKEQFAKDKRGDEIAGHLIKTDKPHTAAQLAEHLDGDEDQIAEVLTASPNFEEVPSRPGFWFVTAETKAAAARK